MVFMGDWKGGRYEEMTRRSLLLRIGIENTQAVLPTRCNFNFAQERFEYEVDVIEGPRTLFIDRPDLTQRVCSS